MTITPSNRLAAILLRSLLVGLLSPAALLTGSPAARADLVIGGPHEPGGVRLDPGAQAAEATRNATSRRLDLPPLSLFGPDPLECFALGAGSAADAARLRREVDRGGMRHVVLFLPGIGTLDAWCRVR